MHARSMAAAPDAPHNGSPPPLQQDESDSDTDASSFGLSRLQLEQKQRDPDTTSIQAPCILLLLFLCALVSYKASSSWPAPGPSLFGANPNPGSVPAAIAKLSEQLRLATPPAHTAEPAELRDWERANPCRSRLELPQQYLARREAIHPPRHLPGLLQQYEALHRRCRRANPDLTLAFLSKNDSSGCRFLVAEAGNGIGNRILWTASNLLYAILTQRVLLLDPRSRVPDLVCEPFPGSSWLAPPDFPFADLRPELWATAGEFTSKIDGGKGKTPSVYAARGDDSWGPAARFYCTTEQRAFQEVPWLTLGGCLYFLPELFAVPAFRPVLEALFGERIPLTHLLRYGLLPVDAVWARVKRVQKAYMRGADRVVGVHVRYRDGYAEYRERNGVVNRNVLNCAVENGILPNRSVAVWGREGDGKGRRVMVFIASLYGGLYDFLGGRFPEEGTESGEVVGLVQLTREGDQYSGLDVDERALVEIMCLSLADQLLTSPMSTYSELAQAYGGLTPWIISFEEGGGCIRGQSMDGCYQGGASTYVCPYDPELDGKAVVKLVPSLKPCQDASGLQLVH